MPTDKRARQRAARYEKQAELQKAKARRRQVRRGLSLVVLILVVILLVVLIGSSSSKKLKTASPSPKTTTTTTTVAAVTGSVPTCPSAKETTRIIVFTKAPPDCIAKTSVWDATFDTSLGKFVVEMNAATSYAAVNNFVFLARWNYYAGTFFHRIIPGFVVQGGDPTGTGTGGPHHDPGYQFTGNFPPLSCKTKPVAALCYEPGDFVMANSNPSPQVQNASTDGSQFFIVLPGGQTQLNTEPTYTLFGKVISGMAVVDKIGSDGTSSGTPKVKVYVLSVKVTQTKP
ncbi:MAG: peptidylprolyl isomerase [Acidimicrobiales bacterium]